MKKMISILLSLLIIFGVYPNLKVQAATIYIGQYVQMGSYYDEPILWRCVDIDENGPLMLSDKILTIKAYDAEGDNTANGSSHGRSRDNGYYRKKNGSDYWADSNMRSWLNSTASAGNVNWLCGNPPDAVHLWDGYNAYSNEKGFMADGNFTSSERNTIKTVTQKSLLNGYEYTYPGINPNYHIYNWDIASVVQNYDTAYAEQVTDTMFMLDVKQVNKVYQNLGNYYIGQPTQKAVDNSEYKYSDLRVGNDWYYWLRSPHAGNNYGCTVRYVNSDGYVYYSVACDNYLGVRPAFYINLSSAIFTSGDGSLETPYSLDDASTACDVVTSTIPANATIGTNTITAIVPNNTTSITVSITPSADATWKLYSDALCTTEIENKLMELAVGTNTAYVKVTAPDSIETKIYTLSITRGTIISIGQYVQMGSYYGEPILWRCVDIDENGPLMLSDKILTIKAYDAKGTNTANGSSHGRADNNGYYRKQNGSDYWADSNMRSWLNSTATAGNVNWLCGDPPDAAHVWDGYNAYSSEKGFMADGNFTSSERSIIKTVTQKSLLNGYEYTYPKQDPNYHIYDSDIASVVQNYDTAYSEQVTDTMFLLDVKQVNKVYQNLGNYYIGQPTQKAVDNSQYKNSELSADNNWHYWLRSPRADDYAGIYVRYVHSGGYVYLNNVGNYGLGVRPAFYINLSSAIFTSGNGSLGSPYDVKTPGMTVSNVAIVAQTENSTTLQLVVDVVKNVEGTLSGDFLLAAYNECGDLLAITRAPISISNSTDILNSTLNVPVTVDENIVFKLFVWDSLRQMKVLTSFSRYLYEPARSIEINTVLESIHPYNSSMNETKIYTYDGNCQSIDITFSDDTQTEGSYDFIYILDENNNQIGNSYSGSSLAGVTINIPGNTVKVRLTSDGSETDYGYRTTKIVVNK